MFFLDDILKRIFYFCLIAIAFLISYVLYDVLYAVKVHNFISNFIESHWWLKFFIKTILEIDRIGWIKTAIIVLSPIIVTFVIIFGTSGGFSFRRKRKTVDYHRQIKGWWR